MFLRAWLPTGRCQRQPGRPLQQAAPVGSETGQPPDRKIIGKEINLIIRRLDGRRSRLSPSIETAFLFEVMMTDLKTLLEISSRDHSHLCPRQILGVRLGLLGMRSLGFDQPPANKRILVIVETDGCFADGVSAATGFTVGHRTMRVEDYGKTAAVFVDTVTSLAVRVSPALDIRTRAYDYVPNEPRHYFAQMQAYQVMPDEVMFTVRTVVLNTSVAAIVSRPGVRAICSNCGEEMINEREVKVGDLTLCKTCAEGGYYTEYTPSDHALFSSPIIKIPTLLSPSER